MPKRPVRSWVLSALACWLTLLASADDFNLARLTLPPTADSEESLPLDDPNTDFTQSAQSPGPTTTSRDRCGYTSFVGQSSARAALRSLLAVLAPSHPQRHSSNTPLRC